MILGTNTDIKLSLFLDGNEIEKSQEVVLLGIKIDDKLSFKIYIENICRKAKYKLHALQRIRKYLSTEKAKALTLQCFYKQPVLLCAINLDVCRETVNLKSTKYPISILTSGT